MRVLTAAALAVDAVVHTRLAPGYQPAAPDGIGASNLFLAEAAAAALAGLYVLIRGSSRPAEPDPTALAPRQISAHDDR